MLCGVKKFAQKLLQVTDLIPEIVALWENR